MSSPAERFAAARTRAAWESTPAGRFTGSLDFELDRFQLDAIEAVQEGHGVLVAAPTGAGKTVVGEFAVALGLETGRKTFYTTPIKALSNQKFHDLVARHGAANVGLLTGDASINGEAPVVVMTTEVLRNMMYSSSPTLTGLGFVVMDEVHYLADRWRGAVWEEVIIHLPPSVQVISLSATVSNAEEFGDWLTTVRGGESGLQTRVIVSEHRPVPLWQHMMVGRQLFDLFVTDGSGGGTAVVGGTTRVNPELLERISSAERAAQSGGWHRADEGAPRGRRGEPRRGGGGRGDRGARGGRDHGGRDRGRGGRSDRSRGYGDARGYGRDDAVPAGGALPGGVASRAQVIERLERDGLLPAITFIFSRAGCDGAVQQLLGRGVRLIADEESVAIRDLVARRVETAAVDPADLGVLGYHDFAEGLSRGYAAHHAGMLPLFREIVEELFTAGRVRAVFATETLALGINMPARTVVLEKLVKFNGETHAPVTPAEYTQLTGRAGRRGIDIEGHAVVLWRRGTDPMDVAGLASTRTYPLRSSFRPSSNMAVNLVSQYGRERAHELLQASFAQFQADRSVVGLTTQVRDNLKGLGGYAEAMACERGDFREYGRLRHELSELEKKQAKRRQAERRADIAQAMEELEPGQVIRLDGGRKGSMAVVLRSPKRSTASPEVSVITSNGSLQRLVVAGFRDVPEVVGTLRVPQHFNPRSPKARKDLAAALRSTVHEDPYPGRSRPTPTGRSAVPDRTVGDARPDGRRGRAPASISAQVDDLRVRLKAHPAHSCPDREEHARWAARWWQLRKETDDLQRRVAHRTNTVAKTFERICDLLADLGYLTPDGQQVTDEGQRLRRIYTELDLVVAESIRRGAWARLTPADLASVVSAIIHEPRGDESAEPPVPSVEVAEALGEMGAIWREVQDAKREHDLTGDRELDPGITWMMHRWASGRGLEEVLRGGELSAGDFVRRAKQVVDLLGQVAQAADPDLRRTARRASDAVLRGVVGADRLD